jgi:hypothetical protein
LRKQYKTNILDADLSNLEKDIVWKDSQNDELKNKLLSDINKLSFRSKIAKIMGLPVRICVVAAVIFIAFVMVKQEDFNVGHSSNGSIPNKINSSEQQIQNKDVSVTFTREEQDLVERVNGNKDLFLSEEAVIPPDVLIPSVIGEPKINVTKENNRVLVSVTYPVKGDKFLTIDTAINKQGSEKLAYDSLVKKYSDFRTLLTIGSHQAILVKSPEVDGAPKLIVVSNEFLYYISGGESSDDLIKVADMIHFTKK